MLLPRKDSENVEHMIERTLMNTMVSGGVRPFQNAGPVRRSNPAGTGLFLVKPAMAGSAGEMPSRVEKIEAVGGRNLRASSGGQIERSRTSARVIAMSVPEQQVRRETLLDLMAVMGPMLWFGHAALVWLKIV